MKEKDPVGVPVISKSDLGDRKIDIIQGIIGIEYGFDIFPVDHESASTFHGFGGAWKTSGADS